MKQLFDVHYQCYRSATILIGRVAVCADDKDEAAQVIFALMDMPRSQTTLNIKPVEYGFLPVGGKEVPKPQDTVQPQNPPINKREREIARAAQQIKDRDKPKPQRSNPATLLQKYICRASGLVTALNDAHAERLFAEELMSRAQKMPRVSRGVEEITVNIDVVKDMRPRRVG